MKFWPTRSHGVGPLAELPERSDVSNILFHFNLCPFTLSFQTGSLTHAWVGSSHLATVRTKVPPRIPNDMNGSLLLKLFHEKNKVFDCLSQCY